MPEYGGYLSASDGCLSDPETSEVLYETARGHAARLRRKLEDEGYTVGETKFIEQRHSRVVPPSVELMVSWGWDQADIDAELSYWNDETESIFQDYLGWKMRAEKAEVEDAVGDVV